MMLKNPFKLFGANRGKKSHGKNKTNSSEEEEQGIEDLDEATEALEDMFITSQMSMDTDDADEDSNSQSSEATTIALLSSATVMGQKELEKEEEKYSER